MGRVRNNEVQPALLGLRQAREAVAHVGDRAISKFVDPDRLACSGDRERIHVGEHEICTRGAAQESKSDETRPGAKFEAPPMRSQSRGLVDKRGAERRVPAAVGHIRARQVLYGYAARCVPRGPGLGPRRLLH